MTMIEKFLAFARALPADRRESVEESLAALMESFAQKYDFTPEQMAELDRRVDNHSICESSALQIFRKKTPRNTAPYSGLSATE